MDEEKIRVLNMVKEGKLTVEEALKVIEALEVPADEGPQLPETKAKWLKIKVLDLNTGKSKVSVTLPMGLVDWALRTGTKVASLGGADLNGMGIDMEELRHAIRYGLRGKIVDVTDEDSGEHVEIVVE